MCNAYTLSKPAKEVIDSFELNGGADFDMNYNVRPTQLVPVIIQGENPGLSFFYWGTTPGFSKNKALAEKLYIVRSENIIETGLHAHAMETRRCLLPADGFYLWRPISKKGLVPYRYFINENRLFAFAGLWEEFEDNNGQTIHTCSIISTTANDLVKESASRMPVILEMKAAEQWLTGSVDEATSLLLPFDGNKMGGFAVSTKVNNPENNGPELIEPAPPADQFGNYNLFD